MSGRPQIGSPRDASAPWFDRDGALREIPRRAIVGNVEDDLLRLGHDFVRDGFCLLPSLIEPSLCDSIVADFDGFVASHGEYAATHTDDSGRHLRFVNLHRRSAAAMEAGHNPRLMRTLDFLFGRRAGIYTSLYFEYGSQQMLHRDSPFFHTYPMNYFVGVWIALEDIDPKSGPLMYVPGGHRFTVDQRAIYEETRLNYPEKDENWIVLQALQVYYGVVARTAAAIAEPVTITMRKGDAAIWHPALPHGGSPAIDRRRTRKSIVFHCAPVDIQVHQHVAFFTSDAEPPARYGFKQFRDRAYADAGEPAFQVQEKAT